SVDVIGSLLYADTQGAGKGTLLARTKVRYRHAGAERGEPWYGSTVITVRGPGGSKTVRDVDLLRHAAAGQIVDHRVVIGRAEAARILGPAGARAKVRLRVRGHLELRAPLGEMAAAGNGGAGASGGNGGAGGNGGSGVFGAVGSLVNTGSFPPVGANWGSPDGELTVNWTFSQPYQPYVAGLYIYDAGNGAGSVSMQPDYDGNDNPTSGVITPGNTFTIQAPLNDGFCVPGATFTASGSVPPHTSAQAGGVFITGNAVASWNSSNCGYVANFGGPAATYYPGW
ncbi:MAG: hypothetical protein ACKOGE_03230, partial [Actinomycetota bacterium]